MYFRWFSLLFVLLLLPTCMEIGEESDFEGFETEFMEIENALTDSQLQQRCDIVKARAANKGITNALIIAGISNHETGMAQCYNEYTKGFACNNVGNSADCPTGTGGVLGGGGDGVCDLKKGGIGMFQLDAGTYTNTTNTYGSAILNVSGNTDAGVDFVIKKLGFQCTYTPCFDAQNPGTSGACLASYSDPADVQVALAWFNSATPGTAAYDTFMTALAACYNGCLPGWTGCGSGSTTHEQIKAMYKAAIDSLYAKFGASYWYPTSGGSCSGAGPYSGSGSGGNSGSKCISTYSFPVTAGSTYTISTCDSYSGDPYLKVNGTCTCNNDDSCGLGSKCTCKATSNGTATICASTYGSTSASWSYKVTATCSGTAICSGAGPFSGSGSGGSSGSSCLNSYNFATVAGKSYKISTCSNFSGDPYLKVSGTCTCSNDDACGAYSSECTCTATANGTATICASTYGSSSAFWNYNVTCL
ncbi:MAG: hypothetical protein HYV41_01495 [Candidatus Magasanikbacteria bacterium]|nr:hypothetical protein [Candidatus Magasanikbacteria bacterium]